MRKETASRTGVVILLLIFLIMVFISTITKLEYPRESVQMESTPSVEIETNPSQHPPVMTATALLPNNSGLLTNTPTAEYRIPTLTLTVEALFALITKVSEPEIVATVFPTVDGAIKIMGYPELRRCPTWSPGGRWIAFVEGDSDSRRMISLTDFWGREYIWLFHDFVSETEDCELTWSPDNQYLVFDRLTPIIRKIKVSDAMEMWLKLSNTSSFRSVDVSFAYTWSPSWSPDGEEIVFVGLGDSGQQLFIVNVESGEVRAIPGTDSLDAHPDWSPDGERIVFQSGRDGNEEIYVMKVDGSEVVRLTENEARDANPVWSPDGERIAFQSDRDGDEEIYVMNADGSGVQQVTDNPGADKDADWSPDGKWLVFVSDRGGYDDIFKIGVATPEP